MESLANPSDLKNADLVETMQESTADTEADTGVDKNTLEEFIYNQFCDQNVRLINSCLENSEKEESVNFNISKSVSSNVQVIEIAKDGNCLFSAFAHQLFCIKVNSSDHIKHSKEMRRRAVEFITDNLCDFRHDIIGRTNDQKNVESFVMQLQNDGFWGGLESLRAGSIIFKANIIIFNDIGDVYSTFSLKSPFSEIVLLSYRCAETGGSERNHYESVTQRYL